MGPGVHVLFEKYADRETRNPAAPVIQDVSGVSIPIGSCGENQGLFSEVLGPGYPVFSIDKVGYVQGVYGISYELLGELDIWDGPPQRFRLQPKWNGHLWACIADEPDQPLQLKLINLQDGYTGVVAWSNEKPSVLEVALITLDRLGLKLDPVWSELIFGGN